MKPVILGLLFFVLTACGGDEPGAGSASGPGTGTEPVVATGRIQEWQVSLAGQEGHGGDAIVCFSIPIERALAHADVPPGDGCQPDGTCIVHSGPTPNDLWRMTEEGRRSIQSAKPLEQYLGERIAGKKVILDQLNQMPVKDGYAKVIKTFSKLPGAYSRVAEAHRRLGWLLDDGIASEYGLADINDSGFVNESEIDRTHCKELQAVVRRDNQLWYDADIVKHFDNAGMVLMQLHEEIYAWAKQMDEINFSVPYRPAHETSTKTRRLILKVLDPNMATETVNENLKDFGFSALYLENLYRLPTSPGFYMDSDACRAEQKSLRALFPASTNYYWQEVMRLFEGRYLTASRADRNPQLRFNYPSAISNMIAYTLDYRGTDEQFRKEILNMLQKFERDGACEGGV